MPDGAFAAAAVYWIGEVNAMTEAVNDSSNLWAVDGSRMLAMLSQRKTVIDRKKDL